MSRIVVIGGGIVGASAAWHLRGRGAEVVLIDRLDAGRATSAGAGVISPGTSLKAGPEALAFGALATGYYPELVAALHEAGAPDTGYEVVGELLCARNGEEAERIPAMFDLFQKRLQSGMPNMGAVTRIDGRAAKEMFPALGDIPAAIHVAGAARVDGALMRDALLAAASGLGIDRREGSASLVLDHETVRGVVVQGETITADAVILAGGAWANEVLADLGVAIGVEPQRGQIVHITMPGTDTSRWPIIQKLSDQYLLGFGPDRVVAGATREFGSGFDYRLTVGGMQSVLEDALSVAPGLAAGTVKEWRIGFRPLSRDGKPYIGAVPQAPNVIVATGLGPSGLMLGPYTGKLAAHLALGEPVDADLSAFHIDRPAI